MKLKNTLLFLIYSHFFALGSFAQITDSEIQNLHPKTAAFALEVYNEVVDYQTPAYLVGYSNEIKRVRVENVGSSAASYPSLETVGLMNKYNPSLTVDKDGFDPENFNPLKYFFNFYSTEIQKFRVGNTGYIIILDAFKD